MTSAKIAKQSLPPVMIVTPGGLEHGGGIGRMVGYMLNAWYSIPDHPKFSIHDPRGPGHIVFSPIYLALCLLAILVKSFRAPLLHVHVAGRGSTIRKIIVVHWASLLKLRIVLHLHDYNYRSFCARLPPVALAVVRSMFRRSHQVVVLSNADRKLVLEEFGLAAERITVVPNAVPAPPVSVQGLRRTTGEAHILFLGQLSRRKGVHDLLNALATEPLVGLNWHATLAGGGPHLDEFRAQAKMLGISRKVDILGWIDIFAVRKLLERSNILVLPSYDEGMAMSTLEGMSYGLAVVCTPVGALADVIKSGVSGIFVQPGDIHGLSRALADCVRDPALRLRLGEGAAKSFADNYNVTLYPEKILTIYRAAASIPDTTP